MIPNVVYIFSALLLSSFTRSIAFPLFLLCVVNTLFYWPYIETHDQHFFNALETKKWHTKNLHEKLDHLLFSNHTVQDSMDDRPIAELLVNCSRDNDNKRKAFTTNELFRHYHLAYLTDSTRFFILFSFVGYLLSQTIRYPPMLDSIYVNGGIFYCFKVIFGIMVYHLTLIPVLFLGGFYGTILCCFLSTIWSFMFYMLLTMEEIRWQSPKGIRTLLFYVNTMIFSTILFYSTGIWLIKIQNSETYLERSSPESKTSHSTMVVVVALLDIVFILLLRVTHLRHRKSPTCAKLYAQDVQQSILKRFWFGINVSENWAPSGAQTGLSSSESQYVLPLYNNNRTAISTEFAYESTPKDRSLKSKAHRKTGFFNNMFHLLTCQKFRPKRMPVRMMENCDVTDSYSDETSSTPRDYSHATNIDKQISNSSASILEPEIMATDQCATRSVFSTEKTRHSTKQTGLTNRRKNSGKVHQSDDNSTEDYILSPEEQKKLLKELKRKERKLSATKMQNQQLQESLLRQRQQQQLNDNTDSLRQINRHHVDEEDPVNQPKAQSSEGFELRSVSKTSLQSSVPVSKEKSNKSKKLSFSGAQFD